jgi:hypothetical protein
MPGARAPVNDGSSSASAPWICTSGRGRANTQPSPASVTSTSSSPIRFSW